MTLATYEKLVQQLANFAEEVTLFMLKKPIILNTTDAKYVDLAGVTEILPVLYEEIEQLSLDAYKNVALMTKLIDIFKFAGDIFRLEKQHVPEEIQPILNFANSPLYIKIKDYKKFRRRFSRGVLEKNIPFSYRISGIEALGELGRQVLSCITISDLNYLKGENVELFMMVDHLAKFLVAYVAAYLLPSNFSGTDHELLALVTKLYVIQDKARVSLSCRSLCDDDIFVLGTAAVYPQEIEVNDDDHHCSFCDACKRREKVKNRDYCITEKNSLKCLGSFSFLFWVFSVYNAVLFHELKIFRIVIQ